MPRAPVREWSPDPAHGIVMPGGRVNIPRAFGEAELTETEAAIAAGASALA